MAEPVNPYDAVVDGLISRITALRAQIANLTISATAEWARYQDWGGNTPQGRESYARHIALVAQITTSNSNLAELERELETARANRDAINRAAAERIAAGESPTDAYNNSSQQFEAKELVYKVLRIGALVLLAGAVIYGIVLFRRWRKKSK